MTTIQPTLTIKLSDNEAYELEGQLNGLLATRSDESLEAVQQRLDEAHWLGHWMRDYTHLDMTRDEAVDVLHALIENLDERCPEALTEIVEQLDKILADSGWTDPDNSPPASVDYIQQTR